MSNDSKGFLVYGDIEEVVNRLSDDEAGQLFKGMISYFKTGVVPKFKGVLEFVFIPIRQQIDRDADKYEAKCEKNRANANKRWQNNATACDRMQSDAMDANTNTNTNTNTKKKTNTTTNTKADAGGGSGVDGIYGIEDEFNIWKKLTPEDVDTIYESYPNSGGDLIQAVYEDVKKKRKKVSKAVPYILGYADRVLWDDNAEHGGTS